MFVIELRQEIPFPLSYFSNSNFKVNFNSENQVRIHSSSKF